MRESPLEVVWRALAGGRWADVVAAAVRRERTCIGADLHELRRYLRSELGRFGLITSGVILGLGALVTGLVLSLEPFVPVWCGALGCGVAILFGVALVWRRRPEPPELRSDRIAALLVLAVGQPFETARRATGGDEVSSREPRSSASSCRMNSMSP